MTTRVPRRCDRPPTARALGTSLLFFVSSRDGAARLQQAHCWRAGSSAGAKLVRPPANSARRWSSTLPMTSTREGADQLRHNFYKRAVGPQPCPEDQPPANGARLDQLQNSVNSQAAHPTRQSCDKTRFPRITERQLQLNSNAAITRAGSIARFERRDCSGVALIA